MEWSAESSLLWDWDSSPPRPPADFGLLAGGGGGGASPGSELGTAGSSKTSVSVSIDSSPRVGDEVLEDEKNPKNQERRHLWQDTMPGAAVAGSNDLVMGLKLGKRTYFEDASAENDAKTPSARLGSGKAPAVPVKKTRVSPQSVHSVYCQVEGCTDDLSTAKDYHRKHKVCEAHSKSPLVIVAGQERRFCQQCSRFHALSKFDQKKRSCRKRLSHHNARRRKPHPEVIPFNPTAMQSSTYANKQHINLLWNKDPSDSSENFGNSKWESSYAFKFPRESGLWQKPAKERSCSGVLRLPNADLYGDSFMQVDRLFPLKAPNAEVLSQGSEPSIVASNLNGAPDLRRALSLLSGGSWVQPEHGETSSLAQLVDPNRIGSPHSVVRVVASNSNVLLDGKPLTTNAQALPFPLQSNGGQIKELQLHKASSGPNFFGSSQIH